MPLDDRSPPPPPLRVFGAHQNNLKGFDLEIPHDRLTVITGVSGSGKSSLAFDTIFAEGQWRYLESLPSYARLLLEKTARPEVEALENVRPAVALEQQNTVRSARSIVGTATELYDLFRVLYANFGESRCPACGEPARRWTPAAAAREALARFAGTPVSVEVPLERLELARERWVEELQGRGFARVEFEGVVHRLDEAGLPPFPPPGALLVLDRVRCEPERLDRLTRALGEAFTLSDGWAELSPSPGERMPVGLRRRCYPCGTDLPELRPVLFSFNHPLGACPTCTGFGAILVWDEAKVVPDPTLTLAQGAIDPWQKPANRWWQEELFRLAKREGIPLDVPWAELPEETRRKVWAGTSRLEGVEDFFAYLESKRYKMHVRVFLSRYRSPSPCPACKGERLRPEVLAVRLGGKSIAEVDAMSLGELSAWVRDLSRTHEGTTELLWRIEEKLDVLLRLGLHYLSMGRTMRTLSGGEAQRVALAAQLSSRLAGTLYVLDEPTSGLHPRDVGRLSEILGELADAGNTVLCVEHDLSMVRRASYVVELGPGGGRDGGRVLYAGSPSGLARADTATGRNLASAGHRERLRPERAPAGHLNLLGCRLHNLKGIDVAFPLGVFTCVTGLSGSGKSSLVAETLVPAAAVGSARADLTDVELRGPRITAVRAIDQDPMGRTPRSIPLTYVGAYGAVRDVFADLPASRALGLGAGSFSFNVKGGRCEACQGTGLEKVEMLFFEDLYVPCETCGGRRFRSEVLSARYRGRSIHEVLSTTVDEGLELFEGVTPVERPLKLLQEMGLGYLVLGQPSTTLSGGEAQRLKIAAELLGRAPRGVLYVLDEPTTGLHADDVARLVRTLQRLVDGGNTVVAVEHNLAFMAEADWIVDLGPGGGDEGGRVVDVGTPRQVAARALGPTGSHLGRFLNGEDQPSGGRQSRREAL